MTPTLDISALKQSLATRWEDALATLGGCPAELLDGKHHPCPKCGGTDRFRYFNDGTGGAYCNQCFNSENADGISTLRWLTGRSFPEVLKDLEQYLGNGHSNGNGKTSTTKQPTKSYATPQEVFDTVYHNLGKRSGDWLYLNADCDLVGWIARWDTPSGKEIRPASRIAGGRWIAAGMPEPWPLYCLPELADAKRVYVCEGEKATDAARSIGLTATTSPHGSKSAAKADWTPLAGKEIIILPDNDAAGKFYVEAVKAILAKLTPLPSVKVVELPGLPEAGDIVEWIDAHGDAAEPEAMRVEIEAMASAAEETSDEKLPAFAKMLSSAELVALDTRPKFLIQNVLVEGMPAIIGGKSKALKTSIMLDAAVSLGSGRPFLNSFSVSEKMPVAVWSGESGPPTIRAKAIAIAESKGVFLQDCPILWNFALPKLSRDDHLEIMRDIIKKNRVAVSFIDPLYLALLNAQTANQAGNLFAMGNALEGLSRLSQELNTTIVLLHHFRKSATESDEPCSLEMLSQSGVGEWARGWILLQRQNPFTGDGKHELLMRTGSSVGFGGLYSVSIDEGVLGDDFTGRQWEVTVSNAGDYREVAKQREQTRRDECRKARESENLETDRREVVAAALKLKRPESKTGLRELSACGHTRFNRAFASLVADGTFQEATIDKPNGQKYPAWRLRDEQ
jgi:hypothetical protein